MAAMMHNVPPLAFVNMCRSGCTLQPDLCQTRSSADVSELSGVMSQSDQPENIKLICQP